MDELIITNNPLVFRDDCQLLVVEGDFLDVLKKARDVVYKGFKLINHPLPASIRMFYSPIRSIAVRKGFSEESCRCMEESIEVYQRTMGIRKPDYRNRSDYGKLDLSLLDQAMAEQHQF